MKTGLDGKFGENLQLYNKLMTHNAEMFPLHDRCSATVVTRAVVTSTPQSNAAMTGTAAVHVVIRAPVAMAVGAVQV